MIDFIHIRFWDVLDIVLVAYLMFEIYRWVKGTVALRILIGIVGLYLAWILVRFFKMELLSSILSQVLGVGVIALFIVFQQEIRKFLLMIGSEYFSHNKFSIRNWFKRKNNIQWLYNVPIDELIRAVRRMSEKKSGALIAIQRSSSLNSFIETGDRLDSLCHRHLIETIFFKNTALHDGAMIVVQERIAAARCILPVSEQSDLPAQFGTRHRAALGLSEVTDALVIVVSEETGSISLAERGHLHYNIGAIELRKRLEQALK